MNVRFFLVLAPLACLGCDKSQSSSQAQTTGAQPASSAPPPATVATATTAAPKANPTPPAVCPNCEDNKGPPIFSFTGKYRDAACTEPVAHADVHACAPVNVTAVSPIRVTDEPAKKGLQPMRTVVRQLNPDEATKLYEKRDGVCAAYEPRGFKLTPLGCDGKKICRQASGDLACSNCRMLDNGCADNVTSRTYVLLSSK